jgi:hypothetical protein
MNREEHWDFAIAAILGRQLCRHLQYLGYTIPEDELLGNCRAAAMALIQGLEMRNYIMETGALEAPLAFSVQAD